MPEKQKLDAKVLAIINISLVLVSTLLILNLFDVNISHVGYAIQDTIDIDPATCFASYNDLNSEINLDLCCQESKKQLSCINKKQNINGIETDIICKTGDTTISYSLTNKAQRYCEANY
tara:strand:- start:1758 stop:2114 length:357 start_codon:yes stop_codon:yes gene_type:complete